MKILSIGNSFSQDAHRYLHRLAAHDGVEMKTVNLYIGGCTLRTHYLNMLDDADAYSFEFNGEKTGIKVSIREALVSDDWDVVTLQQASGFSGRRESYSPYIEELAAYVRKYCPHTKIWIHQTWAYEADSAKLKNLIDYVTPLDMLAALRAAYREAAALVGAVGIIPCGEAMMQALTLGMEKVHRDTFHASLGFGRYLLALCWFSTLTGCDISNNSFDGLDVPMTEHEREIAIAAVRAARDMA